jgi:hypothetical protein
MGPPFQHVRRPCYILAAAPPLHGSKKLRSDRTHGTAACCTCYLLTTLIYEPQRGRTSIGRTTQRLYTWTSPRSARSKLCTIHHNVLGSLCHGLPIDPRGAVVLSLTLELGLGSLTRRAALSYEIDRRPECGENGYIRPSRDALQTSSTSPIPSHTLANPTPISQLRSQ